MNPIWTGLIVAVIAFAMGWIIGYLSGRLKKLQASAQEEGRQMTRLISEEDCTKLAVLLHTAANTPLTARSARSARSAIEGKDPAYVAQDRVAAFQKELGGKYGYDHADNVINIETGEIAAMADIPEL